MTDKKSAIWISVGIGVGVAIGAATHSMALWMCLGLVVGAANGVVLDRRSTSPTKVEGLMRFAPLERLDFVGRQARHWVYAEGRVR